MSDFDGPELVPAALRCYRYWGVETSVSNDHLDRRTQVRLKAVSHSVYWDTTQVARCATQRHPDLPPPERKCSCGLWAYYFPEGAHQHSGPIFGVVEVSGRVLMGSLGVRAQKATILALAPKPEIILEMPAGLPEHISLGHWYSETLGKLAERYSVPVFDTAQELVKAFPPEDVSALLPPEDGVISTHHFRRDWPFGHTELVVELYASRRAKVRRRDYHRDLGPMRYSEDWMNVPGNNSWVIRFQIPSPSYGLKTPMWSEGEYATPEITDLWTIEVVTPSEWRA